MENDDDEIDFYDLSRIILRWRFFIIAIIVSGLLIISWMYYIAPVSYTSTGTIKIGKVSGIPIEKYEDLKLYLLSLNQEGIKTADLAIDKKSSSLNLDTLVLTLAVSDASYDVSRSIIDNTEKIIIKRHEKLFNESMQRFKSINYSNVRSDQVNFYLISSYSYPSGIIGNINTVQIKSNISVSVNEKNQKGPVFHRGLLRYFIITLVGFTFLGMISTFIIDYCYNVYKKTKN